ncbi:MAG: hypothetical protein ACFFD4_24135 [Candidatus Odinarchaeota archaeon]
MNEQEKTDSPMFIKVIIKSYPTGLLRETIRSNTVRFADQPSQFAKKYRVEFGSRKAGEISFQIWHLFNVTPEEERFADDLSPYYASGAQVALFIFSKGERETLEKARIGYQNFKKFMGEDCTVFFIGVKAETETVTVKDIEAVKEIEEVDYHEINDNAKGLDELFEKIAPYFD